MQGPMASQDSPAKALGTCQDRLVRGAHPQPLDPASCQLPSATTHQASWWPLPGESGKNRRHGPDPEQGKGTLIQDAEGVSRKMTITYPARLSPG